MKAQKFTLLVIDDNEDDCFFIGRAFSKLGLSYRVHLLPSGNEALAYLKGEGKYEDRTKFQFPSYIITDLKMPFGDGFEVLNFLQENPALSVIPVVMISASDDTDDIRQAYRSACEVPPVDDEGCALITDSKGKLGARFSRPKR